LGFQAYVKAETVDRSHHHFLRLDSSKCPGKQDECLPVIGIHVLDDLGCSVSQQIGYRRSPWELLERGSACTF
jgi:hypothetical protein